jgi:predicted nuclease of predicted toxin-antitoxin system
VSKKFISLFACQKSFIFVLENVTSSILKFLRSLKHDVLTLKDLHKRGLLNGQVAKLAIENNAIIVTFDEDYSELKNAIQHEIRVIYIHMQKINPLLERKLLQKHLDYCLEKLNQPGKVIITEKTCSFKEPLEK